MTSYVDDIQISADDATAITGTAVDQNGNPLPENTTITAWGPTEAAFDTGDAQELRREAEQLTEELSNPLPSAWTEQDFSVDDHTSVDTTYALVHEQNDWDMGWGVQQISSGVDTPATTASPDQDIVISLWDPEAGGGVVGGALGGNQVYNSFPGQTTSGTVVVEQLSPTDGVTNRETYETSTIAQAGGVGTSTDIPGVRTQLPTGVYRAYPEDNQAAGYVFTVGSPSQLASAFTEDLRNERNQLTERAQRIRDLLSQERVIQRTTTTGPNGTFAVDVPANTISVQINAMRGDGEILRDLQDPSIEDLREARLDGGYNGSVILPSPSPKSVTPPASNVTVTGYKSPTVPFSNMSSYADLMSFLDNQRLNETISDLKSEYDKRFGEMERSTLERIYSDHRTLVETAPGAKSRYLDRSDFDEIQNATDLTDAELTQETNHMQLALANIGDIEPPDLTEGDVVDIIEDRDDLQITPDPENVTDAAGFIEVDYPLPEGVNPDTIAPELHWSNGSVQPIADQYWEIQSDGMFGGETLVVSGIPIEDTDPAAFDIRVQAASSDDSIIGGGGQDGLLDDRIGGLNPAAAGAAPVIDAVDFSTLSPGPSERVYVGIDAAEDSGYDRLVAAEAWNDDGAQINATVDEAGNQAYFETDGTGTHTVQLVYENQQGDRYTLTERIDAKQQSRTNPATVRASGDPDSMAGLYAVTGDNLEGARLESNGGTLTVDVIAEDSGGPGQLSVQPANAMDGTKHTIDVNVLYGSDEQRVSGNIPVNIHLENTQATTIYWRSAASFGGDPITHGGGTRYGSVDKPNDEKHIVRTYTEPDGSVTVTTIESAGLWQRSTHQVARWIGSIPFVSGFIGGLFSSSGGAAGAGILGIGGFAIKRRRSQA